MKCKEASSLIYTYMNHKPLGDKLEPFIKHVSNCKDCHEELEMNFIMVEGIRRLENGEGMAINYQQALNKQLKNELHLIKFKRRTKLQMILIGGFISLAGILLGSFETSAHRELVDQQTIRNRGAHYYYMDTRKYIFEYGNYQPESIQEIIHGSK